MGSASDSVKKITGAGALLGLPDVAGTGATVAAGQAARHAVQPDIPSVPDIPAPTAMPIPGQDALANIISRRRSIQAQLARRGRLATILSQPATEPLGGAG